MYFLTMLCTCKYLNTYNLQLLLSIVLKGFIITMCELPYKACVQQVLNYMYKCIINIIKTGVNFFTATHLLVLMRCLPLASVHRVLYQHQ